MQEIVRTIYGLSPHIAEGFHLDTVPTGNLLYPLRLDSENALQGRHWDIVLRSAQRAEIVPERELSYFGNTLLIKPEDRKITLYTGNKDCRITEGNNRDNLFRLAFGLRCVQYMPYLRRIEDRGECALHVLFMRADAASHAHITVQDETSYECARDALSPMLSGAREVIDTAIKDCRDLGVWDFYNELRASHSV